MFFGWFVGFFMGADIFNWLLLASIMSGVFLLLSFAKPDMCGIACLVIGFILFARAAALYLSNDSFIWMGLYGVLSVVSFAVYFVKDDEYVAPVIAQQFPPLQ